MLKLGADPTLPRAGRRGFCVLNVAIPAWFNQEDPSESGSNSLFSHVMGLMFEYGNAWTFRCHVHQGFTYLDMDILVGHP